MLLKIINFHTPKIIFRGIISRKIYKQTLVYCSTDPESKYKPPEYSKFLMQRITHAQCFKAVVHKTSLWQLSPRELMSSQLICVRIKYMIYSQLIRSFITYGASSWSAASEHVLLKMQRKENKILRRLVGATRYNTNIEVKLLLNHVDLIENVQYTREKELQKLSVILGN